MNDRLIAIVSDRYTDYLRFTIEPIIQRLYQNGYGVILMVGRDLDTVESSFEVPQHTSRNICEKAIQLDVDGFILYGGCLAAGVEPDALNDYLPLFQHKPTVMQGLHTPLFPSVLPDNVDSMRILMEHMTEGSKRKRFVFIRGPVFNADSKQREQVFREVLASKSIPVDENLIINGRFLASDSYTAMTELLRTTTDFDAVVAANDIMAISAVIALQEYGMRVPEEVIVSGFDGIPAGKHRFLQITTIDQNFIAQGCHSVDLLLSSISRAQFSTGIKETSSRTPSPTSATGAEEMIQVKTGLRLYESTVAQADDEVILELLTANMMELVSSEQPVVASYTYFDLKKSLNRNGDWFIEALRHSMRTGSARAIEAYIEICDSVGSQLCHQLWFKSLKFCLVRYLEYHLGSEEASKGQVVIKNLLNRIYADVEYADEAEKFSVTRLDELLVRLHIILAASPDIDHILETLNQFFNVMNIKNAFVVLDDRFFNGDSGRLKLVQQSANGMHSIVDGQSYPASEILPPEWRHELAQKFIAITPLRSNSVEYGYLAIDPTNSRISSIEPIADSISLALRSCDLLNNLKEQTRELKHSNAALTVAANTDSLTRLSNRTHFDDHLRSLTDGKINNGVRFALFYIDLDGFKNVNDSMGHRVGDQFLLHVANQIIDAAGEDAFVARLGGDEFAIVKKYARVSGDEAGYLLEYAEQFNDAIVFSSERYSQDQDVTASIGIARFPEDGEKAETLVRNADTAMYHAKGEGKDRAKLFHTSMADKELAKKKMDHDMRVGLGDSQFRMVFQPRYHVASGELTAFESLMRWEAPVPEGTRAPGPDVFITLAEETGFIHELGSFALNESCRQARQWQKAGMPVVVAVNLSAKQLQHPDIVEQIRQTLELHELPAKLLEIEITETAAMTDVGDSIAKLTELRKLGTEISVDDFGTGYSSMNYLKRLPITNLKIDRSFLSDVLTADGGESVDAAIVKAVVALGQSLGFTLIAEGVETEQQLQFLRALGCHEAQGYLFSPPVELHAATELLGECLTRAA